MVVPFQDFSFNAISLPYFPILIASALLLTIYFISFKSKPIYLLDFSCYQAPDHLRVPTSNFIEHAEICNVHERASIDFQTKASIRSGIGSEAAVPLPIHEIPPNKSYKLSCEEIETVLFTIIEHLLEKNKINPKDIDIIVSNCSIFCPTPSMTAMVINKFGFRSNVKSVSLSGMGCSAGLLSISLVKDLLKIHTNSLALVLSMEAITPNGYHGDVKSMLLSNALFRMGGVAILLSNKKHDKNRAKYKLRHLIRTHMGFDDQSYQSVFQETDEDGHVGVSLSRSLLKVAGNALKRNISELGSRVLPYSEQIRYVFSLMFKKKGPYVPDFRKAFDHFCIHAGGRAVIDAVEENLKLSKEDSEASRMTLYRFGNTSSSSVWYELSYLEGKGRVKKGNKIWQIGFGSGFKCNSAVWECISEIDCMEKSAWSDRIHLYPVDIPNILDH